MSHNPANPATKVAITFCIVEGDGGGIPPPMVAVDMAWQADVSASDSEDVGVVVGDIARARELYAELRQMSVESGSGVEEIMTSLRTESNDSLSSIIPMDKKQELQR